MNLPLRPLLALSLFASLASLATAQTFPSDKVRLIRQFTLSQLGAGSGNTCWGYVSPSGREYILMGLDNKTTIVEVTDNENPRIVTSVAHSTGGIWSDIKTYRNAMYVSTENSASGIQVIDLGNIDNGVATLVRTIPSPGRNHTIHVDEVSGFLYTCGSRDGTGTTTVFSLTNPLNPVRVGANSLTNVYQHETQVHTYTSGPYAGRQIFFGGGEGRGLEIWDVTNKNAPVLIRRVAYQFVGYCHQGWLSADKRYFYVNDEFDEFENNLTSRTLVFDVSVLETADLVSTYTTGRRSVDHNLYLKNDFVFKSNYSSGLWIYDANDNPLQPRYCGFFDTFPADDRVDFVGAWGNYPFLPSGVVAISDINRGLFIVDVSDATRVVAQTNAFRAFRGQVVGGDLASLRTVDQNFLTLSKGIVVNNQEAPIQLEFETTARWQDVSRLGVRLRNGVNSTGLQQRLEVFDWVANAWVEVQRVAAPTADTSFTVNLTNPDRFIQAGTRRVLARLAVQAVAPVSQADWRLRVDLAEFTANP